MRRAIELGLASVAIAVRLATPSGVVSAPRVLAAAPARIACVITDHRVIGLSGLIAMSRGYVSISDSNFDKSKIRIFFLDKKCGYVKSIGYPTAAYDPEDMALGRDGTIYVADIGDNASTRTSIAVWRLAKGSSTPRIVRYSYPDHAHDAEAMLLASDDSPIFVTKDIGLGNIYVPTRAADPTRAPVPLRKVGSFSPDAPFTPNGFGLAGGLFVTGGANSPDRTRVALRTYSTLYEWRVVGGDVVKTLISTRPVATPLPNEPQGESVAYSEDGQHVFTVSDQETQPIKTKILEYASGLDAAPPVTASPSSSVSRSAVASPATSPASVSTVWWIALGVGSIFVLIGIIVYGMARRRS